MRREIYRALNTDYIDKTGDPVPHLTYQKPPRKELVSKGGADAKLEELVELCDQDAESCNAHDFCGSHRLLASLLHRHLGRLSATNIMLDVARYGGQHGMGGIARSGDAYADLNVGKCGYDWLGEFPA